MEDRSLILRRQHTAAAHETGAMSWVEYSSDDDALSRRAAWRRHDESDSSDSAKKGLRKASHRAKNQVKAATNDTETFVDTRKSHIAIAAAIAAGLAIAGLVVSKVRGAKDRTAGSDREAVPPSESDSQLSATTQPKKLAARRKRSGRLPEANAALSSAPSSPRHKHARHENVEEPSTSNAPPAAEKASAQPAKTSRSKTITKGPSKRPALPSRDTAASWSSSDQQGAGHAPHQDSNGDDSPAPTSSAPQEPSDSKAGATPQDTPQLSRLPSLPARKERALHSGQTLDSEAPKAATASEEVSEADPASSSQTGSGRGKGSEENEEQGGEEDEEQGPGAHKDEGGDEEGALRKPATGQEEDEGPEATEKAEQAVKEAAEAINKQLPQEAQGGSMQPLVEEKEEGEGQALDTFSVEIDALDQSKHKKSGDSEEAEGEEKDAKKKNKGTAGGSRKPDEPSKDKEGDETKSGEEEAGDKEEGQAGDSQGKKEQGVDEKSADKHQGKEEEEGKDKAGEGKPVVNPLEDKEPVMHPPQPVPVRLDSEPLESASSQGSAEGQEKKADNSQAESAEEEVSSKEFDSSKGQQEEASGQGKQVKQKQPDLATVAEDDSGDETPPHPPLQRAPSPSASHSSTEGISPQKEKDPNKKDADPEHTSAFGHADVQAQRAFSGRASDSGDLGKKPSASAYSGLNPTSTRSASRMLSDAPPPTSKKPSGPISKRDILANSILQMDMDHELDTFTADIDCLMDSSDEEAEEQAAAKGKKQGGEGAKGEPSAGEREDSGQKKSKKGKDENEEDDEGEDDDAANVEDLGSPEQRERMEIIDDEEADEDKKKGKDEEEEDASEKPSADKGNDHNEKDDDKDDKPEGGSGGGAAASGSSPAESTGKGDKAGGGKPSAGSGKGKSKGKGKGKGKGKQGAVSSKGSSETHKGQSLEQALNSDSASSDSAGSRSVPQSQTEPASKPANQSDAGPTHGSAHNSEAESGAASSPEVDSASASATDPSSGVGPAQDSELSAEAAQRPEPGSVIKSQTEPASKPATQSGAGPTHGVGPAQDSELSAEAAQGPESGEVPDPSQAAKAANVTLHPATHHLTDALDSELHSVVGQVAPNLRAADAEFSAQGSVVLPDLDTAKRELDHGDSAESPRSPHTFGLGDMSQYADIDLTKDLNDPNAAQLVGADTDSESEPLVEFSGDESVPQVEQLPKGDDTVPQIESPPVADLDDLHAETPEIIGSDAKYAPVLSVKDQASQDGAKGQQSSAQVASKSQGPSTPEAAGPAPPQAQGASLSDSDSSGPGASPSGSATAVGVQRDKEQEGQEDSVMLDMDFIQQHRGALASSPLVGDLAGIKAREEFIPSSKAEKHAARLHAEAGKLYNEAENKQQGERLQRQVLQYLVKQQAHPGMVSAVASNLGDMLWEQEHFEEAESILEQALKAATKARHSLKVQKLSNNLGAVQRKKLGKFDAAYEVHQEALIKALKAFGRASHYTLLARGQVVEVLSELHQQATAEVLLQEAVDDLLDEAHAHQEEYRKKHDVFSEDEESEDAKQLKAEANQACLIAARSSADLGKLHASQGKDSEAEDCFQTALATVETVAGRGHPETAFALGAYASFLKERQDEASRRKAVELYKVLQRIMQEEHGFDNDQNAMVLRVLSDTLESLQQYGEAAEYAQKSVKALGEMLGKDHPALESFWQAVADLLQKAGDKAAAKKAQRQADRIRKLQRKSQLNSSDKCNSMPKTRSRAGPASN
ncbi:hypothetical protein WJX79_000444 [Trebouxia sp. C0005]